MNKFEQASSDAHQVSLTGGWGQGGRGGGGVGLRWSNTSWIMVK